MKIVTESRKIKNGYAGNYDLAMIFNFSQKCN